MTDAWRRPLALGGARRLLPLAFVALLAIATVVGLFLSTLLGAGLFSLAFFSDKSGHDSDAARSTTPRRD